MESAVELLLEAGDKPTVEALRAVLNEPENTAVPTLRVPQPDLAEFDALLTGGGR